MDLGVDVRNIRCIHRGENMFELKTRQGATFMRLVEEVLSDGVEVRTLTA